MTTMSEKHTRITELYELQVKDVEEPLDTKKSFVKRTADVDLVFSLLSQKNHVWVIDDEKTSHVLGVITHSDMMQLFAPPYTSLQPYDKPSLQSLQYGLSSTAEDLMSKQPITVHRNEKIIDVIAKMQQHKVKQLAVVDETERLIGEVSLSRLIQLYSTHHGKSIE